VPLRHACVCCASIHLPLARLCSTQRPARLGGVRVAQTHHPGARRVGGCGRRCAGKGHLARSRALPRDPGAGAQWHWRGRGVSGWAQPVWQGHGWGWSHGITHRGLAALEDTFGVRWRPPAPSVHLKKPRLNAWATALVAFTTCIPFMHWKTHLACDGGHPRQACTLKSQG